MNENGNATFVHDASDQTAIADNGSAVTPKVEPDKVLIKEEPHPIDARAETMTRMLRRQKRESLRLVDMQRLGVLDRSILTLVMRTKKPIGAPTKIISHGPCSGNFS